MPLLGLPLSAAIRVHCVADAALRAMALSWMRQGRLMGGKYMESTQKKRPTVAAAMARRPYRDRSECDEDAAVGCLPLIELIKASRTEMR